MNRLIKLITNSFNKFQINLDGLFVLTEAATGNYACTPILAALSGATVYALAKESQYGSVDQIKSEIRSIAERLNISEFIFIIENLDEIEIKKIDIVTNTGFVRPIGKTLIDMLKRDCVISLMWEPWEYRPNELDLDTAINKGLKVYGTNEADPRLQTMKYIGIIVLYLLLKEKRSCFSSRVLIIGCEEFLEPIISVLRKNNYFINSYLTDKYEKVNITDFDTIVVAEHNNPKMILGNSPESLILNSSLTEEQLVIHIAGNVDFNMIRCQHYPEKPSSFGYMSFRADYIDPSAVIDLHSAGLKVAEGMIKANSRGLKGIEYKQYLESNYPAKAFGDKKYW